MGDDALRASWAATDTDLRWVLAHSDLSEEGAEAVRMYLDHNELGEAYETLRFCLHEPSGEVRNRFDLAARRMGLISTE